VNSSNSGFTQAQNEIFAEIIEFLNASYDNEQQDKIVSDVIYRYITPGLDKRWAGIPLDLLNYFYKLVQTFTKDNWEYIPYYYSSFRDSFYSGYKRDLVEKANKLAEEERIEAKEEENIRFANIRLEEEKQIAKVASEKKELVDAEIEKEAIKKKNLDSARRNREIVSAKAEDLRKVARDVSRNGRVAVPHEFDRSYSAAIFEEAIELCKEALSSGNIDFAIQRITELVLEGNPSSRALTIRLGAQNKEAELVVAFLYLGRATKFIAPIRRGRQTENGRVYDQLYAYNLVWRFTETKQQALVFAAFFTEPTDLASRVIIVNTIYECIKNENYPIEDFMHLLVEYIPLEAMDVLFLKSSIMFPKLGDWRSRFYRLLDVDPDYYEKIINDSFALDAEYLSLVHNEFLATKGDLEATQELLRAGKQSSFNADIVDLSITQKAEYIEKLVSAGRASNALATQYLSQDGSIKNLEILKALFELPDLDTSNFLEVCRLLENQVDASYLLEIVDSYEFEEEDEEFSRLRIRLLFATRKLDDLILIDAEKEFTDEDDVLRLALLTLEEDEYVACRQLLERKFGTFRSILDLEAISQMSKSRLVDYLPYILKYENIVDPKIITEVAVLEILENRKSNAALRLRPLLESGDADAAALMLTAQVPNTETPFEELELALQTKDLELRIVAYREIAKRYAHLGNIEMAKAFAEPIANDDIESAYLLATVIKDSLTAYWAIEVLDRSDIAQQTFLKATFIDYGFTSFSELEDYNLHKYLISPKQRNVESRPSSQGIRVSEDWYCRKSLLSETAELQSERMRLSYNFTSCKVHHVAFRQRVQFGFNIPTNHSIDEISIANFLQDAIPRSLKDNPTQSMRLIIEDLALQGFEPREWQQKAFLEWVQHGRHGMIEAVTGSGKSYLGALAAAEALDDGYAVLIVVPTQILCDQWIEGPLKALHRKNLVNKIGNARSNIAPDAHSVVPGKITVAVMKSIVDNPGYLPGNHINSCLIADEIHNYGGQETSKVLGANFRRRLGMTATLADSESLAFFKNYFGGDAIYAYDFETAVREKAVSNFDLVLIGVMPNDLEKNLYTEAEYQVRLSKDELIRKFAIPRDSVGFEKGIAALENANKGAEIVAKYKSLKRRADSIVANSQSKLKAISTVAGFVSMRGNTIVFSDVNSNAKNVQQILANEGVLGEVVNAEVSPTERREFVQKLFDKKLSALISPKALDEGIDIKGLTVGLFVGVQGQRRRLIQRLGRVLRVQEGKSKPVVIIPFNVGSTEDPNVPGNDRLQLGKFDFIGANADSIRDFHVNDQSEIREYLSSLA